MQSSNTFGGTNGNLRVWRKLLKIDMAAGLHTEHWILKSFKTRKMSGIHTSFVH